MLAVRPPGRFRRAGRFDPQPEQAAAVMLASYGMPFPKAAIKEALRLSEGRPIGVITIARVYGSAFGLPNPGLLPTSKELAERRAEVEYAVRAIEARGVEAWGQVTASRRPARAIVKASRARQAGHIVVCTGVAPRWRTIVEGDPVKELRRRARNQIDVTGVVSPVKPPEESRH
jgi:hypothetical protein